MIGRFRNFLSGNEQRGRILRNFETQFENCCQDGKDCYNSSSPPDNLSLRADSFVLMKERQK